jgi:hypothetical protein
MDHLLRDLYGFDWPDDLFRFWNFARRLQPLDPLEALAEPLGIVLVGPFEVLAGRFNGRTPRCSQVLHWRYFDDPPEFFTVLAGDTDGLHWGYYLDDPGPDRVSRPTVASYYVSDAYELSADGDSLFEAVRLAVEHAQRDNEDFLAEESENAAFYTEKLRHITRLRERLLAVATAERTETGDEYLSRYSGSWARSEWVVARTLEGMGIVVPEGTYRPLSLSNRELWKRLRQDPDPAEVVEEARQALRDGFPGTALKLGKDLWALTGARRTAYAVELLTAAYEALGRDVLLSILQTHRAHRDLPSVDILEEDHLQEDE